MSVNIDLIFEANNILDKDRDALLEAGNTFFKDYFNEEEFGIDFLGEQGNLVINSYYPVGVSRAAEWIPKVEKKWEQIVTAINPNSEASLILEFPDIEAEVVEPEEAVREIQFATEEIGLAGADEVIKTNFPKAKLLLEGEGLSTFDYVFEHIEDGQKEYLVVTAKCSEARLSETIIDKETEQEGTKNFFQSIVNKLQTSKDISLQDLGNKLAVPGANVRYLLAHSTLDFNDEYEGTSLQEFNIN